MLERHSNLTLTRLYNVLEALRAAEASGGVLPDKERDIAERGCVSLIRHYHDAIDVAVAEAYGWGDLVKGEEQHPPVRPEPVEGPSFPAAPAEEQDSPSTGSGRTAKGGADAVAGSSPDANGVLTGPPHDAASGRGGVWIEGADDIILERLVALNRERAAEEARGQVRWLRPEYQAPAYVAPEEQAALALPEQAAKGADILEWPAKLPEQVVAVAAIVERAGRPVAANDVARAFKGKRGGTIAPVLDALAGMGRLRKLEDGRFAA